MVLKLPQLHRCRMGQMRPPPEFSQRELQPTEGQQLFERLLHANDYTAAPSSKDQGAASVKVFLQQVFDRLIPITDDLERDIQRRVQQIDHLISLQLNEIFHHPKFQKVESTWRGLKYLIEYSELSPYLKIKVLDVSKRELIRDLQRVPEVDQSILFKKIVQDPYEQPESEPFSVLVGDYEFSHHPEDMELLAQMSEIASSAHAPFLAAPAPELLNIDSFNNLDSVRDFAKTFDTSDYAKWRSFRQAESSRYVGLCLPRILLRKPYGRDATPIECFDYLESTGRGGHTTYVWGNAAYALAARLNSAFTEYGWCAAIRGVEGGGLVEGLPMHRVRRDDGEETFLGPAEVSITDRREKELADQGFIPLINCKGTDYAAFFSVQSCQKPKIYDSEVANANARLNAQLTYTLVMSRFAHYMKVMMLHRVGHFLSRADCERFLTEWLSQHVSPDENTSLEMQARLPLGQASIEVIEIPGKPGALRAAVYLKPRFQMPEVTVSLRLVVDLPQRARL